MRGFIFLYFILGFLFYSEAFYFYFFIFVYVVTGAKGYTYCCTIPIWCYYYYCGFHYRSSSDVAA